MNNLNEYTLSEIISLEGIITKKINNFEFMKSKNVPINENLLFTLLEKRQKLVDKIEKHIDEL